MTANPPLPVVPSVPGRASPPLRALCGGAVHLPGDPGYDAARAPWNVAVDQRPAVVAYPADPAEVAEVLLAARSAGLRVAAQGTGHNAAPLDALDDVVLLRTAAMKGVRIDPVTRIMRVEAGVLWQDAVEVAADHDLATLHGSSPDVGVVGYSLGGGIGWYARRLGLQANSVTAVEVVTADGHLLRADREHETDLFWALRGGGGCFGVVTALEFRVYPLAAPYAGILVWDATEAARVLHRWAEWAPGAPDAVTTALRLLAVPPVHEMPEAFRGRTILMIDGAVLADPQDAQAMLEPLTELRPETCTFAAVPPHTLTRLHMEPEGPTPGVSHSSMLTSLPPAGVDALLEVAGPDSGTSLLLSAELRQLGGALGRPHPGAGALPQLEGQFALFSGTLAFDAEAAVRGDAEARRTVDALAPWSGGYHLNRAEDRLRSIRAAVDPDGLFVANHPVPASDRAS